jgi:hypothetical protein
LIEEDGPVPPAELVVQWMSEAADHSAYLSSVDGDVVGVVARHIVSGRFGPGGERRVAVVRSDDRLLIVNPSGEVEVVAELRRGGPMAVRDFDGDGSDSLMVTIPDHGVVWLEFGGE